MKKLIVANWKLNPENARKARLLAQATDNSNTVICPPFLYLDLVKSSLKKAKIGAQDAFWENKGPFTGEVSPAQLKAMGVKYVIIGHSKRREVFGETDTMINKKIKASLEMGLRVILCIGEDSSTHNRGKAATKKHLSKQLKLDLANIKNTKDVIVAYEPLWAVGKGGQADTPEEAEEMTSHIKNQLGKRQKVLYGGSVNSRNAKSFLEKKSIDGLLIGRVSLKPKEFNKICS